MMDKDVKKKIDAFIEGEIEELPEDVIEEISADSYIKLIEMTNERALMGRMEKVNNDLLVSAASMRYSYNYMDRVSCD